MTTSELSGFYRLEIDDRRQRVAEITGLSTTELEALSAEAGLSDEQADRMVENVLGVMGLPLGLCVNMRVDGRDCLIPMATEEPSVVAAASYAAKLLRAGGGVTTEVSPPHMIGQIQLLEVPDSASAEKAVLAAEGELLADANAGHPNLVEAGGGAIALEVNHLPSLGEGDPCGPMMVVHLVVDVRDAMGANAINTMCERIAPRIAELTGGRVGLRILSNLADRRRVVARGAVPLEVLVGRGKSSEELARGIVEASVFAERDPYRAATHNKGIMNGIDSVVIATGNDWRAVEAGAHAYAARSGQYRALTTWDRDANGDLVGAIELPIVSGILGGTVNAHPLAKIALKVLDVKTAPEFAGVLACVGLAQNLGALRALAAEGINRGHMALHARQIAIAAGATGEQIDQIADQMAAEKNVSIIRAKELVSELTKDE
jgi:hydroxymethylglutaryl-CoA reductase